jgi:cytosine deaminase
VAHPAVPDARRYALARATIPLTLAPDLQLVGDRDGLALADLVIAEGRIEAILPPGSADPALLTADLDAGLVFPGFVDAHTHLDKGQIWPRARNEDGSWMGAFTAVLADRSANWTAQDVRARMTFALRCAYAHGTVAIRTHLDSRGGQTAISWPVFAEVREEWRGRIDVQASPLFPIDTALDDAHLAEVVGYVSRWGGVLGAATRPCPEEDAAIERLFRTALDKGFALDFHVDETLDPSADALRRIAETACRLRFPHPITVGHCCSLSTQEEADADRTMDLVAQAGIAVVALPMCNLYLQDRRAGRTPRTRGMTLVHELAARGVPVMIASDNTRDPFYAYGDLDMIEVLREATRIGHLDHPHGEWPRAVTSTPAKVLGVEAGRLATGASADLVLLRARTWTELFARPQTDRRVIRAGRVVDATPPDYRDLDPLFA